MVTAYVPPGMEAPPELLTEVTAAGFEVSIVSFEGAEQFADLIAEVEERRLWDPEHNAENAEKALLMVTPLGFRWIFTGAEFRAWLPAVDEIEVV